MPGDLMTIGEWPAKLLRAMAIVDRVHDIYSVQPDVLPGFSKETCLFTSLAIRDFLVAVGFKDATVRGCTALVRAITLQDEDIWSVGLGVPDQAPIPGKFNGHAVCTIPSIEFFVDSTLYPAIRPYWKDALPGMLAGPYQAPYLSDKIMGRHPIARAEMTLDDRKLEVIWLDRPELQWKKDIDFAVKSVRRRRIVEEMVRMFLAQEN